MDKYFMWIHSERFHNHNKAKHNKTVCIFLGIYCRKKMPCLKELKLKQGYQSLLYTLRPRQTHSHFADDTFKWIFLNENLWISLKIFLKFIPKVQINNTPSLVRIMAWCLSGAKALSEPTRTVNATERTQFSKSRPNDLKDIGQGQRSLCATHPLMVVIICIKYGKNPSRTVDATERTRFSRPRPNDLEDIGQGQRSLYATHSLILVIISIKYGKNPSRTVDFFFQGQGQNFFKIC